MQRVLGPCAGQCSVCLHALRRCSEADCGFVAGPTACGFGNCANQAVSFDNFFADNGTEKGYEVPCSSASGRCDQNPGTDRAGRTMCHCREVEREESGLDCPSRQTRRGASATKRFGTFVEGLLESPCCGGFEIGRP